MPLYEYKVIPAPKRGERARGVRSAEARFANTLQAVMNEQADEGWEYQRSDTLPCEQRRGMIGRTTVEQTVLVFRRAVVVEDELGDASADAADQPEAEEQSLPDNPAPKIEPLVLDNRVEVPTLGGVSRKMRAEPASDKRAAG